MRQNGFFAEVIKTTKIKVDESSHVLPPHNGKYKEYKVADYFCPDEWSKDGVFISVKEGASLWFDFRDSGNECAVLCAVQRINPVTGEPADLEGGLTKDPTQNYLRMPEQHWLDGYAKNGKVYQFVVTKAGVGLAVNEYVLPKHMQDSHAIGFAFFSPKNPKPKPILHRRPNISYGLVSKGITKISAGGGSTTMDFSPSEGMVTSSVAPEVGNDIEITTHNCFDYEELYGSNTIEEAAGAAEAITVGELGARGRFTQNRVAENYNEVLEDIETVDILEEQTPDMNELDKASMGAGGRITQSIVTDENTVDYYHEKRSALLTIYFALPEMHKAIMKKGKRQDASKKDKYKMSGQIGGVPVPLVE